MAAKISSRTLFCEVVCQKYFYFKRIALTPTAIVVIQSMSFWTYPMIHRRFPAVPLFLLPLCCSVAGFAAPNEKTTGEAPKNAIQRPISPKAAAARAARDAALRQRSYVLGPGDVLRITVPEFPEFSVDLMTVLPNGTVALPFYGTLKANNRTIEDVQRELRRLLVKRIKPNFANALVLSVPQPRPIIEEADPLAVFMQVLGAVKTQGPVEIKDGFRIFEALSVAGGPASGRLDSVKVTLARAGEPLRTIDLVAISQKPDSPSNIEVRPGDVITVSEIPDEAKPVFLSGAVTRPNTYYMRRLPQPGAPELSEKPHLSELLLLAGGLSIPVPATGTVPIENSAYNYKGVLFRDNQTLELNVQQALSKADPAADIVLQPRDYINVTLVPPVTVRVDGLVRAPGQFQMTTGAQFLDAIVKAGGPKPEFDVKDIRASIWRRNIETPLDLDKARLNPNDKKLNVPLQDGDVLQLEEPDFIEVQIAGTVPKPQAAKLPLDSRLMDALINAGGLNPGLKWDKTKITILRREENGKLINLDIDPVKLSELSPEQNVKLKPGDAITIAEVKPEEKEIKIAHIGGQVVKAGMVDFTDNLDLQELILRAGGTTDKAALARVVVQRDGKMQVVDVFDAMKSGKPLNFPVQNHDLVTIPEHTDHVTVMEAVNRPGIVPIPEKGTLKLDEALTAAGGRQTNAQDIVLIRPRVGQPDNPEVLVINPYPTGKKGVNNTQQLQQQLQNGDVIYVYPGKVTESKTRSILSFLGPLGLLFRSF